MHDRRIKYFVIEGEIVFSLNKQNALSKKIMKHISKKIFGESRVHYKCD